MDWLKEMYLDHGAVLGISALLTASSADIAGGRDAAGRLEQALGLAHAFTELCHHAKEEKVLFPIIKKQSDSAVTGLIHEHGRGIELINHIREGAGPEKMRFAGEYDSLIKAHIAKENQFFKECARFLSVQEKNDLADGFAKIDRESLGAGGRDGILERIRALRQSPG